MAKVIGVIPARYESTRLPKKVLRTLGGKPLIQCVWENAKKAKSLDSLIVATDHQDIFKTVEGFGGTVKMTRSDHPSGTDRIVEVIQKETCDLVINIQGDEPFLEPSSIDVLAEALEKDREAQVATLCFGLNSEEVYKDPNVVKVIFDNQGHALYFSRTGIPFYRDFHDNYFCYKHFGIYGYRREFLLKFPKLPVSELESHEKLEQLRILENGFKIKVIPVKHDSLGIDTEDDLLRAETLLAAQK